ncbi:MAG: hypothetical protein K9W43_07135 [Candidatus Thorarchaeota archaeon]|nr:hypothetical protein [Candidatus Thorarchaeota archaeon]
MDDETAKATQISALFSLMLVSIANTIITIGKESSEEFKGVFIAITGHHWTGHGIVVLILFFAFMALGYVLVKRGTLRQDIDLYKLALTTIIVMAIADFAIFLYLFI